jgi:hypothetical protein
LLANLANLFRYRGLIQSLVARELKARYRGSALGFVWSFINPLLLLLIYSFVFTTVMPNTTEGVQPYQLFMFCGILPWTWFSSSLAEGSYDDEGNLIPSRLAEFDEFVSDPAKPVPYFRKKSCVRTGWFTLYWRLRWVPRIHRCGRRSEPRRSPIR